MNPPPPSVSKSKLEIKPPPPPSRAYVICERSLCKPSTGASLNVARRATSKLVNKKLTNVSFTRNAAYYPYQPLILAPSAPQRVEADGRGRSTVLEAAQGRRPVALAMHGAQLIWADT